MTPKLTLRSAAVVFLVVFGAVFAALWLDRTVVGGAARDGGRPSGPRSAGVGPFDFTDASNRVMPSVVNIDCAVRQQTFFGESQLIPAGSGSGVVVQGDGYIVTNAHVVRDPDSKVKVVPADVVKVRTSDGSGYDARIVGIDPLSDLAVIKVEGASLTPASFGDSDAIQVGDWVIAVGNQLGFDNSVSVGVVSSKNRWLDNSGNPENGDDSILVDAIQTDAAINRGNSGGALCNVAGEVVGINSSIATLGGVASGVGFAIPSKHVKRVVQDLIEHGKVRYAVLGIDPAHQSFSLSVPQDRATLSALTDSPDVPDYGVVAANVLPGQPAAEAGIAQFDVILEIDGRRMNSNLDLYRLTMEKRPGDNVAIKLWSKGRTKTVRVQLGAQAG